MNSVLILLLLLLLRRYCCVCCLPKGLSISVSVVFSRGTQLLVHVVEEDDGAPHPQAKMTGAAPSVQIFSSGQLSQDPASPRLLLCLLSGLSSPMQDILWWVDDREEKSSEAWVSWAWSEEDGAYLATSVLEVSAEDWSSGSTYMCGTNQEGKVYRQTLCSED